MIYDLKKSERLSMKIYVHVFQQCERLFMKIHRQFWT